MFTRKPDPVADSFINKGEKPGGESDSPFTTERPATYPKSSKSTSSGKMVPSIIGEDLSISGNVRSKGELQVDGEIQGDINCGSLLLGDKSQVFGGVIAEDVVVRGRVVGSIRGLRVTLQSQAHVEGDIFHQSLAIEQGAYFEGKSRRSDDPIAELKKDEQSASEKSASASRPADKPSTFESRVEPNASLNSTAE